MTHYEHKERHRLLHYYLDELVADFMLLTGKLATDTTVADLLKWANSQQSVPDIPENGFDIHNWVIK